MIASSNSFHSHSSMPVTLAAAQVPETSSTAAAVSERCVVIDGLNVILTTGGDHPRLETLLTVMSWFVREGWDVICICDAVTRHRLRERQGHAHRRTYEQLLARHRDHLYECPAGREADPYVLEEAEARGALVVSNDSFKDHAKYFPWVRDHDRIKRVFVVRDHVYVAGHRLPIAPTLTAAAESLDFLLRDDDRKPLAC